MSRDTWDGREELELRYIAGQYGMYGSPPWPAPQTVIVLNDHGTERCWCPAAHLPPFCLEPSAAQRYRPPRWLVVTAMALVLLTAEAWVLIALTAAWRLVMS